MAVQQTGKKSASGWGGARKGSGQKKVGTPEHDQMVDLNEERALHEKVKREQREFKLAIERGEYLPRVAQRQASATIIAALTQGLRSIPDNLERKFALDPATLEEISKQIDAGLRECANALKALTDDE